MTFRDRARALLERGPVDGVPLRLTSPPDAASFHGIGWWLALVAEWRRDFPGVTFEAVLDCGAAPGLALAALDAGAEAVRVNAPDAVIAALTEIAAARGAVLIPAPPSPSGGRE